MFVRIPTGGLKDAPKAKMPLVAEVTAGVCTVVYET